MFRRIIFATAGLSAATLAIKVHQVDEAPHKLA